MAQKLQTTPYRGVTEFNIKLSQELCKRISNNPQDFDIDPFQTPSYSPQDCIRITSTAQAYVVKAPRRHSLEGIEAAKTEARWASWASELGIAPKVLLIDDATGSFISDFVQSRVSRETNSLQSIRMAITILNRIHNQKLESWMESRKNPVTSVTELIQDVENKELVSTAVMKLLKRAVHVSESALADIEHEVVPCHNDFHNDNLLIDHEGKMWCIDYDSAGLGDPMWDLAYLAAGMHDLDLRNLADEYGTTRDQLKKLSFFYCLSLCQTIVWYALNGSSASGLRDMYVCRLEEYLVGLKC